MQVFHGREGKPSEKRGGPGTTFSGTVYADPVKPHTEGVGINHVCFTPNGRTYWHTHEHGQVLVVTAGRGWVCTDGGKPQEIRQGDMVWISPNERHWHGAASDSFMVHVAISLGKANWQEELAQADFEKAGC
jgi:quercetin dioxygenase-like cupin family protein